MRRLESGKSGLTNRVRAICENTSDAVKIAAAARYFPRTMSQSLAGTVNSNSSVPIFLSSAHTPIVMAGTKNSSKSGNQSVSW